MTDPRSRRRRCFSSWWPRTHSCFRASSTHSRRFGPRSTRSPTKITRSDDVTASRSSSSTASSWQPCRSPITIVREAINQLVHFMAVLGHKMDQLIYGLLWIMYNPGVNDVFLVSGVRAPIGKFLGGLAGVRSPDLGALVVREAV